MFSTPCQECSFFNKEQKICNADEYIEINLTAPGYCRMFNKENLTKIDAVKKCQFDNFDLMIIYHDDIHNINDIKTTIKNFNHIKNKINNIIICTQNKTQEKNKDLISYFSKHVDKKTYKNLRLVFIANKEIKTEEIIHEGLCTYAKSNYVLVLESGDEFIGLEKFKNSINNNLFSRSVFWQFPIRYNDTLTLFWEKNNPYGLYIKDGYKTLGGTHKDGDGKLHTYINKLNSIEHESGINLLWFSENAYISKTR